MVPRAIDYPRRSLRTVVRLSCTGEIHRRAHQGRPPEGPATCLHTVGRSASQKLVNTLAVPIQSCEVQAGVVSSFIHEQRVAPVCYEVLHAVRVPAHKVSGSFSHG